MAGISTFIANRLESCTVFLIISFVILMIILIFLIINIIYYYNLLAKFDKSVAKDISPGYATGVFWVNILGAILVLGLTMYTAYMLYARPYLMIRGTSVYDPKGNLVVLNAESYADKETISQNNLGDGSTGTDDSQVAPNTSRNPSSAQPHPSSSPTINQKATYNPNSPPSGNTSYFRSNITTSTPGTFYNPHPSPTTPSTPPLGMGGIAAKPDSGY